ncbi:NADH dehydrogenase [ubiquinone] 1 alpha subcomplex subunit 13 [Aplysia californica]|uniref:NADH dehydrogenase [ubiquinone] 1 alpha subcomplex subunit 13 n=1 Tax=Aplysia californica TaxID=6500 RepID=A0ABM0JER2_APLCA|nr:NADH dehydrogenase [ubiquinone] 1 alpha subcomplex subunit 13 [Aplysia californica]
MRTDQSPADFRNSPETAATTAAIEVKMVVYKQDLPPGGGFDPIEWAKRTPRKRMGGFTQFFAFVGFTTAAWVAFARNKAKRDREALELRDARIAIEPFILAERDRAFLKHIRKNRDEENELMKDVKGWETGTLWGEPVYHNVRDRFKRASLEEIITHMSPKDQDDFLWDKMKR